MGKGIHYHRMTPRVPNECNCEREENTDASGGIQSISRALDIFFGFKGRQMATGHPD